MNTTYFDCYGVQLGPHEPRANARYVHIEDYDRLRAEVERYRTAITDCIGFAAGRESEWGERATNAFGILKAALAAGKGE